MFIVSGSLPRKAVGKGSQAAVSLQPHCPGITKGTAKDMGTDMSKQAQLPAKREICPYKGE